MKRSLTLCNSVPPVVDVFLTINEVMIVCEITDPFIIKGFLKDSREVNDGRLL